MRIRPGQARPGQGRLMSLYEGQDKVWVGEGRRGEVALLLLSIDLN